MSTPNDTAVQILDACKSYGNKQILKNLNMQVSKGQIYGLLGASGCGKTTLLSCIVGVKKLNSGTIFVLGGRPGTPGSGVPGPRVGFMPQEIALVGEFTVKDAIFYFGRLFEMPLNQIETRFNELSTLLELPPQDRYLKQCSGGQQRRISLAAAMVQNPELLILDEPTVGVDPVLREKIWEHLVEVVNQTKMSVVITTHYIEEARQAHQIGLMRDGRLLAEESPAALLTAFETDSLEEVFLILSKRQEEGKLEAIGPSQSDNLTVSTASVNTLQASTDLLTDKLEKKSRKFTVNWSYNRFKALMDKNWKQFYRNVAGVMFIFLFPFMETLAFVLAIGADVRDINVAIVNHENNHLICPDLDWNNTAIPYNFGDCHFKNLSCRFMHYLEDPMIQKKSVDNLSDAMELGRVGKVTGVIYLPYNFSDSFEIRFNEGKNADEVHLNFGEIKVWLDMSNRQIGEELKYRLYKKYEKFQKDLLTQCDIDTKFADLSQLETFYGDDSISFTDYMVPGIALTLSYFLGTMMTSQIVLTDRFEGIWDRSNIAGVTSLEITVTHFILQAILVIIQTIEIFLILFVYHGIEYVGSIWILFLLAYLQGFAGMCFGFWISVVSSNHSMANIIATGSFYPMLVLCGMIWPLEGMPKFLRIIAKCLPFTIGIESFRSVKNKGWSLRDLTVWNGIGIPILWIAFFAICSTSLIKSKR